MIIDLICRADGCERPRRKTEVFCKDCYRMLPADLRKALWSRDLSYLSAKIAEAKSYLRSEKDA